ncbi:MerR family transcriptional regulator [Yeosuana sp. MJ-SS3]|uniref:MerR family transcriptional regulator n=1 Tax=Gilvirhabdus luticola TaxID=3079858 RepID=A0ABU3U6G4_9FLAO|nr:MerR family transcriptional regulator [Yeosuana sp. MJ-SS3]MDU8885899.1 MerR family transcriptional regulator [Yeosuana sp. MJ-SS3]
MSIYTIAQVVALSGIKAPTLRKWETRYSLFEPHRTETNIRYYSDSQLKKLLNISVLLRNGFKISKIDKMSDEDIYEKIEDILIDSNQEDEITALIISMLEFDENKFDKIIKSHIINNGLLTTTTKIIYPFLNQVGVLWGIDKIIPAQEHFVSSLIKQKMFSSIDLLPLPHADAPSILMFLPENEHHEIGLLLAHFIAKKLGWRVYYLGQNVPTENINAVVEEIHPNAMLTMFIVSTHNNFLSILDELLLNPDIPLLVSGNPEFFENNSHKDLIQLKSPEELIMQLELLSAKNIKTTHA